MAFTTSAGLIVYERSDWGALPPKDDYTRHSVFAAVYHHGGPVGGPRYTKKSAVATVKEWQRFHMGPERGWDDIGYHLLFDGLGRAYLGRPWWAVGAHVARQNTGRIGINYMQDGRHYGLTLGQKRSTKLLIQHGIPKIGFPALKTFINDPRQLAGVWGHDEVPGQSTECPGNALRASMKPLIAAA